MDTALVLSLAPTQTQGECPPRAWKNHDWTLEQSQDGRP